LLQDGGPSRGFDRGQSGATTSQKKATHCEEMSSCVAIAAQIADDGIRPRVPQPEKYTITLCELPTELLPLWCGGRYQVPKGATSKRPDRGYNSYRAKPSVSGVQNDEIVIFDESQINPRYLLEFAR